MTRRFARQGAIALACVLLGVPSGSIAHETDQYSIRMIELEDSTELLNRGFNERLRQIAEEWTGGADPRGFAKRVFYTMGGTHYIDKFERWARRHPEIDMLETPRSESIYRGGPFWSTRVVFFFGLGPVLRINDEFVGADKIGHFLSQGWKYHKRYLKGQTEEQVVGIGQRNEAGIFGYLTTGVFSNADLVANYEGLHFYRSLFEDDVVPGKPAIIAWEGNGARLQREFDFRDHVNAYWDEALNPSVYDALLRKRVSNHLGELCDLYFADPSAFVAPDDEELASRYSLLGLRDATENRLDHRCTPQPTIEAGSRRAAQP